MLTNRKRKIEMELKNIYKPISYELESVKEKIKTQIMLDEDLQGEVFEYFFSKPGKLFRPALTIFSAKAIDEGDSSLQGQLIDLATAVELIHSASLVHDDVIDDETERRGQPPLNKRYGNRMAVLVGDFLYSSAFLLSLRLPEQVTSLLSRTSIRMCVGEMNKLRTTINRSDYLEVIKDKTASFISACCQSGGILAGAGDEEIKCLGDYGMFLGLAYQIKDDFTDGEINFEDLNITAGEWAETAKKSLENLQDTIFKEKMLQLVDYLLLDMP